MQDVPFNVMVKTLKDTIEWKDAEIDELRNLVGDLHHAVYNYVDPEDLRKLDERVEQCGCLKG